MDKFICAMIKRTTCYGAILESLEDQGLEYKDGSIRPVADSGNWEDLPREEQLKWFICTRAVPNVGKDVSFLFENGEHAPLDKILKTCPSMRSVDVFFRFFRPVTEYDLPKKVNLTEERCSRLDIDIDDMVRDFRRSLSEVNTTSYIPVDVITEAYKKGLNDMFFKLMREGG